MNLVSDKVLQQEKGERVFLWLASEADLGKLRQIGIQNPVIIDPDNKHGVEIIAFVPQALYSDLRINKYSFINKFEDPEDVANYSYYSFN